MSRRTALAPALLLAGLLALAPAIAQAQGGPPFIKSLKKIAVLKSTVPSRGDVNPYGVAVVPTTIGKLRAGWVLVSNFNNRKNQQGTGQTIVQISPTGTKRDFARIRAREVPGNACPGGVGLTTALVALKSGWVIVGSLPTKNGMSATAKAGCLIVLDPDGNVAETFAGGDINGPWDMTALDEGSSATLFVTNVLNGTVAASPNVVKKGTVVRMVLAIPANGLPSVTSTTVVGSGFAERTDPAALVVGPTGVGLAEDGTLYVADTVNNRIRAIRDATTRSLSAGTGDPVTKGGNLNAPLGLTMAPNGDILTVNGNNGLLVETTPAGDQLLKRFLDRSGKPRGNGALFGLAVTGNSNGIYYVDDATNTLNLLS